MSDRRYRPRNRWGCKPEEDVCLEHDLPLECPHGCYKATPHKCKFIADPDWTPAVPYDKREPQQ